MFHVKALIVVLVSVSLHFNTSRYWLKRKIENRFADTLIYPVDVKDRGLAISLSKPKQQL